MKRILVLIALIALLMPISEVLRADVKLLMTAPTGAVRGQKVSIPVRMVSDPGTDAAGTQFRVSYPAGIKDLIVTPGLAAITAGKSIQSNQAGPTDIDCLVVGDNNATKIQDGVIATITFTTPVDAPEVVITLVNELASVDPTGTELVTTDGPVKVSLLSRCDVTQDGKTDLVDVLAAANQALGIVPCSTADVNQNGKCNITDVQRIVNASTGQSCRTN
jgi:Cohesin domain